MRFVLFFALFLQLASERDDFVIAEIFWLVLLFIIFPIHVSHYVFIFFEFESHDFLINSTYIFHE